MSRHRKDPLRPLTADERQELTRLSRSLSAPAAQVERSRALLAIADGASYTAAAHQVGRRHNETISAWVSRFNRDGLAAVRPGHGGGPRIRYGADAQQRILAEWARTPQREQDGTAEARMANLLVFPIDSLWAAVRELMRGFGSEPTEAPTLRVRRSCTLL